MVHTAIYSLRWLCCVCALGSGDGGTDKKPTLPYRAPFEDDFILVAGKVTNEKVKVIDGDIICCSVEITHVYWGPALRGKVFDDHSLSRLKQGNWTGLAGPPALRRGEKGIWTLRKKPDDLMVSNFRTTIGWGYRVRETEEPRRYPQIKAQAEKIDLLSKTPKDRWLESLTGYAFDQNPFVTGWAIRALERMHPPRSKSVKDQIVWSNSPEFEKLLDKLLASRSKIPIRGQIALDRVLWARREKTWPTSELRKQIFDEWAQQASKSDEFDEMINLFHNLRRLSQLDAVTVEALAKKLDKNPNLTKESRVLAKRLLGPPY